MESYREQYENIPIPDGLDQAVKRGLRRGRLQRMAGRAAAGLAAAVVLVLMVANIPPLAAGAAEIPVLGELVRIMHMGSGNSETQAVHMDVAVEQESLRFDFDFGVPAYSLIRRSNPDRLILRIHGLERPLPEQTAETLEESSPLNRVYAMACTEKDVMGLVLELAPGQNAAMKQFGNSLQLEFAAAETNTATPRYQLTSLPMESGPELARLTEALLWEGATQFLRTDGQYQVVLGSYPSLERAQMAMEGVRKHTGILLTPELRP